MKLAILPCLGPDRHVRPRQRWAEPDRSVHTGPWQRCAVPDRGVKSQTEMYRSLTEVCSARQRCTGLTEVYRCLTEVYRFRQRCTGPRQSVQIQTEVCGSKMEVYRSRQRRTGPIERCTGPRQTEVYRSRESWHILIFCHGVMITLPCLAGCFAM